MEFLKKKTFWFAIALLATINSFSQTQTELQTAFAKSYTLESEKKYDEAIAVLIAVYDEKSYETNLRLGWLYYVAEKNDKSLNCYQKCILLMPAATEPLWGVLNPLVALEDWVNAEKSYLAIIRLDPRNYTANYKLGLIYYYRKNYISAKKYFDVVLNLFPFDYNALLMSGWTHYFLNNLKDAKVLFQKVLLNSPSDASALEGLGLIK